MKHYLILTWVAISTLNLVACQTSPVSTNTVTPTAIECWYGDTPIIGSAYLDKNNNGIYDSDDSPLEGAKLIISNSLKQPVQEVLTDKGGSAYTQWASSNCYNTESTVELFPITLHMDPPDDNYILIGPQGVEQFCCNPGGAFLFVPSNTPKNIFYDALPATATEIHEHHLFLYAFLKSSYYLAAKMTENDFNLYVQKMSLKPYIPEQSNLNSDDVLRYWNISKNESYRLDAEEPNNGLGWWKVTPSLENIHIRESKVDYVLCKYEEGYLYLVVLGAR